MKKVAIYYFSSSGNTAFLSKALSSGFESYGWEVDLINIENVYNSQTNIEAYNLIGFAMPVFAWNIPLIVDWFIEHIIPPVDPKPFFVFLTYGGIKGNVYFHAVRRISKKNLFCIWNGGIRCEDNHPLLRRKWTLPFILKGVPSAIEYGIVQHSIIEKIMIAYKKNKPKRIWWNPVWVILDIFSFIYFALTEWRMSKLYVIREKCTRCRLCIRFCPTGAIGEDKDGYPVPKQKNCIGCFRCVNICPSGAFQNFGTRRGIRYTRMLDQLKKPERSETLE